MTTAQRNAIPLPALGLLIYNSTTNNFSYFDGIHWTNLGTSGTPNGSTLIDTDNDTKVDVEKTIDNDHIYFSMGGVECFRMKGPHLEVLSSGYSVFMGEGAGANDNLSYGFNVAVGYNALFNNSSGARNVANGAFALYHNISGSYNVANGDDALYNNTTGGNNVANGFYALNSNTSGNNNVAIGAEALTYSTNGSSNVANGYRSLHNNTTGSNNVANGPYTLYSNTTGSGNTAIGSGAFSTLATGYNNSTALGYNTAITASNQARIGSYSVASIGGYANWSNVSDGRFKTNVQENIAGLEFIMKLRPVSYTLDMNYTAKFHHIADSLRLPESETLKATEIQTGFIAQEVEEAAQEIGFDFHGIDAPENDNDHYGLRYAEFVVPLVKAIQEQQELIELQQLQINKLETQAHKMDKLQQQNTNLLQQIKELRNLIRYNN